MSDVPEGSATKEAEQHRASQRRASVSRRSFLSAGIVASGTAAGVALAALTDSRGKSPEKNESDSSEPSLKIFTFGSETEPAHLAVQAGITTEQPANLVLLSFDVKEGLQPADARRLLRLLTQDIGSLTQGVVGIADPEPELSTYPANLSVTVGLGSGFFAAFGLGEAKPAWFVELPAYRIDQLEDRWSGGDLVLQLCGDDQMALAHARKILMSQTRRFLSLRWLQTGFSGARGSRAQGETMRNLMGQVDGTVNPKASADNTLVFITSDSAWRGGSTLVVRRIAMNLDTWDEVDRVGREDSLGRTIATGAPLSGEDERDDPDFSVQNALGFPLIAPYSHVRRARSEDRNQQIYRRSFNYDDAPEPGRLHNTGLVFMSYQASIEKQYMPIQKRLDELDALNEWTTPIGSAVFAILPGLGAQEYLGEGILEPLIAQLER